MFSRLIDHIASILNRLEKNLGLVATAVILALVQYGLAALYVSDVTFGPGPHGVMYGELAQSPLDFSTTNELQYRLLGPILGYLTGVRGEWFPAIPMVFMLGLLTGIYIHYRNRNHQPIEALGMSALVGFSSITYIHFIALGYVDPISYFWIFLAFIFVRKPVWAGLFLGLALLTHEANGFLLPGLLFYLWYENKGKGAQVWLGTLSVIVLSLAPVLLSRWAISQEVDVLYSADYYLSLTHFRDITLLAIPFIPVGAFYTFKLSWLLVAFAMYFVLEDRKWLMAMALGSILVGVGLQATIALDFGRLFNLAFPAILLSAVYLRQKVSQQWFIKGIWAIHFLNFIFLQYYVASQNMHPLFPGIIGYVKAWISGIG